jgi:TrmH family RNA methyltransferase
MIDASASRFPTSAPPLRLSGRCALKLPCILVMFDPMITRGHLKELRELGKKKARGAQGRFLVEGEKMVEEAAASDFEIPEVLYTEAFAKGASGSSVLKLLRRKNPMLTPITERDLGAISDTVTSQGIVAVVSVRRIGLDRIVAGGHRSVLVGLDAVSDPGNLGSIIRSCDWFGIDGLVLGQGSVELYNPKVLRSTMGSVFHLPIIENVDLVTFVGRLRASGYAVYAADGGGEVHAEDARFAGRVFLILGNEAHGVSPALKQIADTRVAIRRYGRAESLNVGVACGVLLSAVRVSSKGDMPNVTHL